MTVESEKAHGTSTVCQVLSYACCISTSDGGQQAGHEDEATLATRTLVKRGLHACRVRSIKARRNQNWLVFFGEPSQVSAG